VLYLERVLSEISVRRRREKFVPGNGFSGFLVFKKHLEHTRILNLFRKMVKKFQDFHKFFTRFFHQIIFSPEKSGEFDQNRIW